MKYIRTEEGIFTIEENIYNQVFAVNSKREWIEFEYIENKIIAKADTIEELCDGFYIDDKLLNRFNKYAMFEKDQYEKFKDITITYTKGKIPLVAYGFVKTDKGLIYVAKLNDKGELELI